MVEANRFSTDAFTEAGYTEHFSGEVANALRRHPRQNGNTPIDPSVTVEIDTSEVIKAVDSGDVNNVLLIYARAVAEAKE